MKSIINTIKLGVFAFICLNSGLEAKSFGSSSSSFRSSSSYSSSRSYSSPSRSYTSSSKSYTSSSPSKSYGSNSKSFTAPSPKSSNSSAQSETKSSWFSKPNTAKPQTSTRPTSNVDAARYEKAVKSGKTFQTREAAIADFKSTKASSYSSRFQTEPSTRPSYIPLSYRNEGRTYNVVYNQQAGGYGYWSGGSPGLGTWMMYDLIQDSVMLNSVMSRDNYYVGKAPVVYRSSGWSYFWFTLLALGVIGVIIYTSFRIYGSAN